jgi:hypothetical protein
MFCLNSTGTALLAWGSSADMVGVWEITPAQLIYKGNVRLALNDDQANKQENNQ